MTENANFAESDSEEGTLIDPNDIEEFVGDGEEYEEIERLEANSHFVVKLYCNTVKLGKKPGDPQLYWFFKRDKQYGGCGHTNYRLRWNKADKLKFIVKCRTGANKMTITY